MAARRQQVGKQRDGLHAFQNVTVDQVLDFRFGPFQKAAFDQVEIVAGQFPDPVRKGSYLLV